MVDVLKNANKPMRLGDILKAIGKDETKESRASLAGSLSAYVRKGRIFMRSGPNEFGLAEWSRAQEEPELPEDFGVAH